MATIPEVVQALARLPGVDAVLLLSDDGLPVHQAGAGVDADELAALTSTLVRAVERLGSATDRGAPQLAVVEYERGRAVLAPLRGGTSLLLLVAPDRNVGELLFTLRQHTPAVAALV